MLITKTYKFTLMAVFFTTTLQSCGNSWMASADRQKSPSALMLKGQLLYDKGSFAAASQIYEQILLDDPSNDRARIRLAYSLNGQAGLGPLGILTKLSAGTAKQSNTSTSAAAAGTSSTPAVSGLTTLTNIAGLSKPEQAAGAKANPQTYAELLKADVLFASKFKNDPVGLKNLGYVVAKLKHLEQSWAVACRLVPKSILDTVVGTSAVRKKYLAVQSCMGGFPAKYQDPAIVFAVALESMSKGSILFQIKLDTNADGKVDAVETASQLSKEITSLQTSAQDFTSPAQINEQVELLNKKMQELQSMGDTLKNELFDLTLAHFELMASLLTAIDGVLPEKVSKTLLGSIKKFEETRSKIGDFVSTSPNKSKATSTQSQISTSAAKATDAADKYYDNFQKSCASNCADKDKFAQNFQSTCAQYDSLKSSYGLPANAEKPKNCGGSGANLNLVNASDLSATSLQLNDFDEQDEEKNLLEFVDIGQSFLN